MARSHHIEPGYTPGRPAQRCYPDAVKAVLRESRRDQSVRDYSVRLVESLYEYYDAASEPRAQEWPVLTAIFPEVTRTLTTGTSTARGLRAVLSGFGTAQDGMSGEEPQDVDAVRTLLESLDIAVYTTDAGGRVTFFNEAAAKLWGWRPPLYDQVWCGSWRIHAPDGSPLPHDQCPMAVCLREKRPVRDKWAYAEQPGGARVPFAPIPTPLLDRRGTMVGAYNVLVDVSEALAAWTPRH